MDTLYSPATFNRIFQTAGTTEPADTVSVWNNQQEESRDQALEGRNRDIILAALRHFQHSIAHEDDLSHLDGIADNSMLNEEVIDSLCAEISAHPVTVDNNNAAGINLAHLSRADVSSLAEAAASKNPAVRETRAGFRILLNRLDENSLPTPAVALIAAWARESGYTDIEFSSQAQLYSQLPVYELSYDSQMMSA